MDESGKVLLMASLVLGLVACITPILPDESRAGYGWLPVEVADAELRVVRRDASVTDLPPSYLGEVRLNPSTDVRQGTTYFGLDTLRGLYVYGSTDGFDPSTFISYLRVPGINSIRVLSPTEIQVNNLDDLVTIDTQFPAQSAELRRERGAADFTFDGPQPSLDDLPPRVYGVGTRYFECYRPSGKTLLGWRPGYSDDLKCYLDE